MIPTGNFDRIVERIPTDKSVGIMIPTYTIGKYRRYMSLLCIKFKQLQAQNDIHCLSGSILQLSNSISCMRAVSASTVAFAC